MSIFEVALEGFIDMNHELALLSKRIGWAAVDGVRGVILRGQRLSERADPEDGGDDASEEHLQPER